jgi:hypothetical protein
LALESVTLTGKLPGAAGALAMFTPSNWLTDATDVLLIPPKPARAILSSNPDGSGSFAVVLLPTDQAGPLPAGWTWSVIFSAIDGVKPFGFSFPLLLADGATQDITAVAQVEPAVNMEAFLQLGGGTMLGPLILAADPVQPLQAATKEYVDEHGTGDKTYSQTFADLAVVAVPHNLSKRPAVTVIDTAQDAVWGDVDYVDLNNLTLTFSSPFSGTVICN